MVDRQTSKSNVNLSFATVYNVSLGWQFTMASRKVESETNESGEMGL